MRPDRKRSKSRSSRRKPSSREIARQIAALGPWFHNLHLPDGTQTAPDHSLGDFPDFKWRKISPFIPSDLSGWHVLDVGCNAGFYSFELARRGALVSAIDINPLYLRQAHWAAKHLGLADRITFQRRQVYDLARDHTRFDLVWFMGVFYHLRYPLLALDILAAKTKRLLLFQSLTMPGNAPDPRLEDLALDDRAVLCRAGWPKMAFIEMKLASDPTNWWAPNRSGAQALLRSSGLRILHSPDPEIFICEPDRKGRVDLRLMNRKELRAATGQD